MKTHFSMEFSNTIEILFQNGLNAYVISAAVKSKSIDRFTIRKTNSIQLSFRKTADISGSVKGYEFNKLLVRIDTGADEIAKYENFDIFFEINTMPYQVQHTALQYFKADGLFEILINNPIFEECIPMNAYETSINNPYEGSDLNEEQRSAVDNIVNKTQIMPPFILFGPAGTGKTSTLVAAISHIVKSTNENILVCAQTNSACDEITERLMKRIKKCDILRIYAKTHPVDRINENLRSVSNIYVHDSHSYFELPSLESIYNFRVVVCTLTTSSCLARARKEKSIWRPDHFQNVIIDECACTTEISSLVAIAGNNN